MSGGQPELVGRVGALWRYPVKSVLGEEIGSVEVGAAGVVGDRRFGIIDGETGLVASGKSPRLWGPLLQARAATGADGEVVIRLPDGREVPTGQADDVLSDYLGRKVALVPEAAPGTSLARDDPDPDGGEVAVTQIAAAAPPGTFFDYSPMQFVTTASLERGGSFHPSGKLDAVRYRPNVIIETLPALDGFVENGWVARELRLGPEVVLSVLIPSPRCVVPTLAHGGLPKDPDALRVPTRHNYVEVPLAGYGKAPCLGAHAGVVRGGRISVGDEVWLAG